MYRVGLDLGNGFVKVIHNGAGNLKRFYFASSVSDAPVPAIYDRKVQSIGPSTWNVGGKFGNFLVGNYAEPQGTIVRRTTSDYRWTDVGFIQALTFTALGQISVRNGTKKFSIVTGLPFSHFDAMAMSARKALNGEHAFILDGREVSIEVECAPVNLGVVPSAIGAWANYAFSDSGEIVKRHPKTVVVDIGTGTTDFAQIRWDFEQDQPIRVRPKSTSIAIGWSQVVNYVLERAVDAGAQGVEYYEVDNCIRFARNLGLIEIKKWADEAIDQVTAAVRSEFTQLYGEAMDVDAVVLCGGPAPIIGERIRQSIKHRNIIIPADPMFAAARGYYLWAKGVAYPDEPQQ